MKTSTARDLVSTLWPEVFQAEESARVHPAREAKRLGSSPPATAMSAVSRHATETLASLKRLAEKRGHEKAVAVTALGRLLSLFRNFGTDLLVSSEKSYRATIVGIHHAIGAIALLEDAAVATNDQELADLCREVLLERRRLALHAEDELAWFAEHPDVAQRRGGLVWGT